MPKKNLMRKGGVVEASFDIEKTMDAITYAIKKLNGIFDLKKGEYNKMKTIKIDNPNSPFKKVIFKYPYTIVYWNLDKFYVYSWCDMSNIGKLQNIKEKTIVECSEDEKFDPEKGLAMAFLKAFGFYGSSYKMNNELDYILRKFKEN